MTGVEVLYDDFALPELDRSKWSLSGSNLSVQSPSGIRFTLPGTEGSYTTVESQDSFDMTYRSVYWNVNFNSKFNGYGRIGVIASSGAEYGFIFRARTQIYEGTEVVDVPTTNTVRVTSGTWSTNALAGTYINLLGAEYKILSNSRATEDDVTLDTLVIDGYWIDTPTEGLGFALYTPQVKFYSKTSGGVYTYHQTRTWDETNFRWIKLQHTNLDRMHWWVSRDGVNYRLIDFKMGVSSSMVNSVQPFMSFTKASSISYPNPEYLQVNFFNTRKAIYRGSGYVSADFNQIPIRDLVPNVQYDILKETSGTQAKIASDRTLTLKSSTVRTNLRTTIRDIDWRFDIKIGANSGTVFWRANDAVSTYVGLQILPTHIILFTQVGATRTEIEDFEIDNLAGVTYSYRIIHAGGTVVVYRNEGNYDPDAVPPRGITYPLELFRASGVSAVNVKGHVGILASTTDVSTDNWSIRPGIAPPAPTSSTSTLYGSLPVPSTWPFDASNFVGQIETMKLVEIGYNDLPLWPTPALDPAYGGFVPGDYDLGFAEFRTYSEDLTAISGTNNYQSTHGAKTVGMSIAVVPGTNTTVNGLTDLFARWCAPHRRPSLVYTPKGGPERVINLVPTPLGRPTPVEQHDLFTILTVSWVVPSGVELGTVPQEVTINAAGAESTMLVTEGSAPTYPKIYIYGPATDPIVYNDTLDSADGNARLGLTGTIEDGEFLELDAQNRTVRYMGSDDPNANRRYMLTTRGWFALTPFENAIRYEDVDGAGTCIIQWRDAWF